LNTGQLPGLDQDSMNSHGGAKIKDVLDYLMNQDGLFQYIRGAANPKQKRSSNEPEPPKAMEFMHLKLQSNLQDE